MLSIPCPWCGPRDESEFAYGGEAHVQHPADPEALDDLAWSRYVFVRANPAGPWIERWCHTAGCRRWLNAERDTVTHEISATYPVGEEAPAHAVTH